MRLRGDTAKFFVILIWSLYFANLYRVFSFLTIASAPAVTIFALTTPPFILIFIPPFCTSLSSVPRNGLPLGDFGKNEIVSILPERKTLNYYLNSSHLF